MLHVGRTMTEAAFLDLQSVECCARVQEVWVPTAFHAHVFVAAGVPHHKVFVIPQPVHATFIFFIFDFHEIFSTFLFFAGVRDTRGSGRLFLYAAHTHCLSSPRSCSSAE